MTSPSSDHQIDTALLRYWIASGEDVLLIDLRDEQESGPDTLPSMMMKLHELPVRMCSLPRDGKIVFACHSGRRSAAAAGYLRQEGYQAWVLSTCDEAAPAPRTELKLAVAEDR